MVRFAGSSGLGYVTVWDDKDRELVSKSDSSGGTISERIEGARAYLVRVQLSSGSARSYDLVVDREQ